MQFSDFINQNLKNGDTMHYANSQSGKIRVPPIRKSHILAALAGLAAVFTLVLGVYTVDPEEVGVVLRFGRYVRTSTPGLNFKIPFVETLKKVPVQRQLKEEFGYRTSKTGIRSEYKTAENIAAESLMLTGDLNCAVVEWTVQYRVEDPVKYLFGVRDVQSTLRNICEAVMREIVGDRSVSEVLTIGREEIGVEAKTRLQQLCDQYGTGISIKLVVLQDVNPPDPVKPSYNEVNQAEQEKDRMINEAKADYNQFIPRARGEAESAIRIAEGYAVDRINRAKGDAERFELLYKEYSMAKDVTKRRLYLETMTEILQKAQKKIIVDDKQKGLLPLLQLQGGESNK